LHGGLSSNAAVPVRLSPMPKGNIFRTIGNVVSKVAPFIGRAIANPLGTAAELGMGILKDVLGIPEGTPEDEILAKVESMTADQALALKAADQVHYRALAALEVQDRDSARDLAKSRGLVHHAIITYVFLTGWFGMTIAAGADWITPSVVSGEWSGVMTLAFGAILGFWFGSSFGSKRKDDAAVARSYET
jgi:hypothetical protein